MQQILSYTLYKIKKFYKLLDLYNHWNQEIRKKILDYFFLFKKF